MLPTNARALDLATGSGRHAVLLAECGFEVFGVDLALESVRAAAAAVRNRGGRLRAWCADLTMSTLPRESFELIVVTRYLQRDLFPGLRRALTPGGVIVYETFTEAQRAHGRGPTSPEHLLRAGELRAYFADYQLLCDEEVGEPDAVARLVARKTTT